LTAIQGAFTSEQGQNRHEWKKAAKVGFEQINFAPSTVCPGPFTTKNQDSRSRGAERGGRKPIDWAF
jgi:hypothetical protein